MAAQGYIKLFREIQVHWLWKERPFSKGQAWIDILLMANHASKRIPIGNEVLEVERGSVITSELKLMERWEWSKTKVRAFLELLEKDKMIVKKSDHKKTTLIVVNYSVWQDSETTNRPTADRLFFDDDDLTIQKPYHQQTASNVYNNSVLQDTETTEKPQKDREKTANRPQTIHKQEYKNVKNEKNNKYISVITDVIGYLNLKCRTSYKVTTQKTQSLIQARIKDGYSLEDFKAIIDKKFISWVGTDYEKYLRPETLFGGKFESYLNEKPRAEQTAINSRYSGVEGVKET